MSYSIEIVALGLKLQFTAADQKDLWRQVSLFQALPDVCPVDGSATRLNYRYIDENDFFEVVSTGTVQYKFPLGQYKKGGDLFTKNMWVMWDTDAKQELTLWENGRLTPPGERIKANAARRVPDAPSQPVAKPSAPVAQAVVKPEPTKATTQETGQKPADPNLEAKKTIIKKFSPIAKGHYGDATWQAAVLRIGKEVAGKEIAGLAELSVFELDKLAALIDLDVLGVKIYGNANDWYEALPVLLTEFGKQTIYELSTAQIKKMAHAMNEQDAAAVIPSGDEDILF